jgi:hypothetical protein
MSPGACFEDFIALWLAAVGLLLGYRILTRQISLAGILTVDGDTFSPTRLQLLLVTVSGLTAYATASLSAHTLLPIPNSLVAVFAFSHAAYIGGKTHSTFFRNGSS